MLEVFLKGNNHTFKLEEKEKPLVKNGGLIK